MSGFNKLDDTITIVIAEDGSVTYQYTSEVGTDDEALSEIIVVNKSGTILPGTGGTGTTLIYIAGAVLVLGAGIVLVVRRRMREE